MSVQSQELYESYRRYWDPLAAALTPFKPVELGLSNPLLMDLPDDWVNIRPKVMIIGQQTYGWGSFGEGYGDDLIAGLMLDYAEFHLGRFYRPTPFWQAAYVVHMSINSPVRPFGFAWTNLVKIDQHASRPSAEIEELVGRHFPVVPHELEIARPDIVVFFTGPYYDERLRRTFAGACLETIAADTPELARVKHEKLPARSFRTYHPGYLARSPETYERVMRKLVDCANSGSDES
jgi:hypothetical protein